MVDPYYSQLAAMQQAANACLGGIGSSIGGVFKKMMKRSRYKYLISVAEDIVLLIESKGIKREEGCELRALVEKIWDMEKGE